MEKSLRVNVIPSPTFRWLKLNDALVSVPEEGEGFSPVSELPKEILTGEEDRELRHIPGGMGAAFDSLMLKAELTKHLIVPKRVRLSAPMIFRYRFREGTNARSVLEITAEEGSEATLFLSYESGKAAGGSASVQLKLRLQKNAKLHLVESTRVGENFTLLHDIGCCTGENAEFRMTEIYFSGQNSYHGLRTDLVGTKSSYHAKLGYLVSGEESLDLNFIANHIGTGTESEMNADGVLREHGRKRFRGTIDLRHGAKGAVGNEMENVLLMDDTIQNQSIPVILCDEEEVEGNHGATIGRLDESLMFYLKSRGMNETEIYEMMADARIDSVIGHVREESVRALLQEQKKARSEA